MCSNRAWARIYVGIKMNENQGVINNQATDMSQRGFVCGLKRMFNLYSKHIKYRLLPRSLLYRFVLIILLPLILLQTIVFVFFYDRHWNTVSRRLALDVAGEIQTVIDYIEWHHPSVEALDDFLNRMDLNLGLKMTFLPNEKLVNEQFEVGGTTFHLVSALLALKYPVDLKDLQDKRHQISIELEKGVLVTVVPRKRFFSSTVHVFIIWMVGSSVLLFWIAFIFMKNQVRSIERLSKASELFGMGHDIPFKPGGANEVRQAGYSFILMKNRILKYLSERTAMLAGVSHDLRTPLTRMKLQLSMMPSDETTHDLLSDITEMEQMLNAYLAFARGEGKEEPQKISLDELLFQLVEKQRKAGQKIDYHSEEKISISGRLNDIMRAISNILTNANRYATQTNVSLGIRNQTAQIIIDDNGPGIPESKRQDVFKAFYRIDASRNKETGGIGLGMTITRDIILSHGGEIELSKSPMGGLRVVMLFPAIVTDDKNI